MTEDKRTEFAMAAVDFASLFNTAFSGEALAGYQVRLTAPEGPSTGGGIQSRQHITLVNEAEGRTVVVGSCDNVEKKAELRPLDLVASQFQQRYDGLSFPVDPVEFARLHGRFTEFFQNQAFLVTAAQPARSGPAAGASRAPGRSTGLVVAIVVLLLLVAAGLVYYFGFHQP